ncbi:hypothetical protein DH2020_037175 [Rehmannia glutinosa]|uniref:Uncharacterized protein n=1 Tax=Rehmannia glutinosa TaxID=99300 RepID=A0ABR0V4S9_REHGL
MGSQISRTYRSSSSRQPLSAAEPPARTISNPSSDSSSQGASLSKADLSSYEAACRADPDLQTFDSKLQVRTSRAINSIAVGVDVRSLSLDSLSEVTECLLGMNQEVDIWKNKELSDLVDDYFENSLVTLDFCTALDSCLKRAGHIESIINVALRKFQEEYNAVSEEKSVKNYSNTLEELRNFRTVGDPFTQDFFKAFNSLDKKLRKLRVWRKVSNVIFVVAFASVLICSVVAAAITAPPVVTALAAAAAIPLGSMGKWLNSIWKNCERDFGGQRDVISTMQIGSFIVIKDLDSIRVLVDRFQIEIEDLLANADFAMRGRRRWWLR